MIRRGTRFAGLLAPVIVLIGCALLPTGCARTPSQGPVDGATSTPVPTPIVPTKPTYVVQRGEVIKTIQFTGRVAPIVQEELFFRTSGYVVAVHVSKGDHVQEGDLLAELESMELRDAQRRITQAEADLHIAELRLTRIRAMDPSPNVAVAEAFLEQTQIALQEAQEHHQDVLNSSGEQEEALKDAARRVSEAELNLKVAEAEYQQALQDLQVYNYDVQIQEQEVEKARMIVRALEEELVAGRVVAPMDGVVISTNLSEGRPAEAYRSVMLIADSDQLEVVGDLYTWQMEQMEEGMPVTAVLTSQPGEEIKGHIRHLPYPYGSGGGSAGVVGEDQSVRVALEVTPAEAGFDMGDLMSVTAVVVRKENVLWLPPQAIRVFEGRKFVAVQEGEAQLRVDVEVGIEGDERVEILEGLTEGQVVIAP
jgi:multidrug efflux pump subunit AcrA (membrane-fusion protein)